MKTDSPIPNIAGQAVIEGVMFRHKSTVATAIRTPKGKIAVRKQKFRSLINKSRLYQLPIIRGIIIFFETLVLGTRILALSAAIATDDKNEKLSVWELILSIVLSLGLILVIFKLAPFALATKLGAVLGGGNIFLNLSEALIKVLIFIIYLVAIGLMPDIRRVYQYHGAEHKAVNCYEAGKRLTVKNVLAATKRQPRCGTTFVIIVFMLSIFFYIAIPFSYGFWLKYAIRILLLPIIAGIGYELIRFTGKRYCSSRTVRTLLAPGMWFQDLTTREPDAQQATVAITALKSIPGVKG